MCLGSVPFAGRADRLLNGGLLAGGCALLACCRRKVLSGERPGLQLFREKLEDL